jgi:hypothetical protein
VRDYLDDQRVALYPPAALRGSARRQHHAHATDARQLSLPVGEVQLVGQLARELVGDVAGAG